MHIALHLLIWCTVINYVILIAWFGAFIFAHDWLYKMNTRWFNIAPETFDAIHYAGIAIYKILILVFCLVPLIAMHLV